MQPSRQRKMLAFICFAHIVSTHLQYVPYHVQITCKMTFMLGAGGDGGGVTAVKTAAEREATVQDGASTILSAKSQDVGTFSRCVSALRMIFILTLTKWFLCL